MVSGPAVVHVVGELETSTEKYKNKDPDTRHQNGQMAFAQYMKALITAMADMGNQFCETRSVDHLFNITIQLKKLEQDQYDSYGTENLVNHTTPIKGRIRRNNLALFSRLPV